MGCASGSTTTATSLGGTGTADPAVNRRNGDRGNKRGIAPTIGAGKEINVGSAGEVHSMDNPPWRVYPINL